MSEKSLKKIHLYVDAKSWDEFLQFVKDRRGKTRGVVWDELKNAIEIYMKKGTKKSYSSNTQSGNNVFKSKTLRIVDATASAVVDMFSKGKTVSIQWIEEWIRLNVSPNPKIVSKYIGFFRHIYVWDMWENKFIKPWTFRRKDGTPRWESETKYLEWMRENGISSVWVESHENKEKQKIEEIFNAKIIE